MIRIERITWFNSPDIVSTKISACEHWGIRLEYEIVDTTAHTAHQVYAPRWISVIHIHLWCYLIYGVDFSTRASMFLVICFCFCAWVDRSWYFCLLYNGHCTDDSLCSEISDMDLAWNDYGDSSVHVYQTRVCVDIDLDMDLSRDSWSLCVQYVWSLDTY